MEPGSMLALGAAFGGAVLDLRYDRVDNRWIVLMWEAGLIYQLCRKGIGGMGSFLLGSGLPIVLLWILFRFRMLGAGDVKLLSALGGIMGAKQVWKCMVGSFLFGAVYSILILFICGNLRERLAYFILYFENYGRTKKIRPYRRKGRRMEHFHFTVPILLSTFLYAGGFY